MNYILTLSIVLHFYPGRICRAVTQLTLYTHIGCCCLLEALYDFRLLGCFQIDFLSERHFYFY
jgi:hypothetical protein